MAGQITEYPAFVHIKPNDAFRQKKKQEADARGFYNLRSNEIWWRDRYHFLDERGYKLRPRFRPGWKPSWKGTDLDPALVEDSIRQYVCGNRFRQLSRLSLFA